MGRQLAEGTSLKGTARLTYTPQDTVRRLSRQFGFHAKQFHERQAHSLDVEVLEMDERHGAMWRIKLSNVGCGCNRFQQQICPASRSWPCSWPRINQALEKMGYNTPNTSTMERFNGTARRMNAHQVRGSLAPDKSTAF